MNVVACITTLNEARTIGPLVDGLKKFCRSVIVVDAGSKDGTFSEAKLHACLGMAFPDRISIRDAILHAWNFVNLNTADIILQIDAGGSHRVEHARHIVELLDDSGCDIAIGSRFLPNSNYIGRFWRREASKLFSAMMNAKTKDNISDWTSGLRAYRSWVVRWLVGRRFETTMHAWQAETLLKGRRTSSLNPPSIIEVPIIYTAGRSSVSLLTLKEAWRVWRMA